MQIVMYVSPNMTSNFTIRENFIGEIQDMEGYISLLTTGRREAMLVDELVDPEEVAAISSKFGCYALDLEGCIILLHPSVLRRLEDSLARSHFCIVDVHPRCKRPVLLDDKMTGVFASAFQSLLEHLKQAMARKPAAGDEKSRILTFPAPLPCSPVAILGWLLGYPVIYTVGLPEASKNSASTGGNCLGAVPLCVFSAEEIGLNFSVPSALLTAPGVKKVLTEFLATMKKRKVRVEKTVVTLPTVAL